MVRRGFTNVFGVFLVLAALSSPCLAEERLPVRVFLRDGSFVLAQAMPEIREDHVFLRLHPSGMLAVLPLERIDFDATAHAAQPVAEEVASEAGLRHRGTVSGGSGSRPAAVKRVSEPEVPVMELQHPDERALEDRYAREFTWLSERQEAVEHAMGALRSREAELDRELHRYLNQPRIAGALAGKLRGVQEELERREAELQEVHREMQILLTRAAARGVRLRRLPPGGGG